MRTIASRKPADGTTWDGGDADPVLSRKKGLNRFVWDMRYSTVPGIQVVYLEASFRGHKAAPGRYRFTLSGETRRSRPKPTSFRIRCIPSMGLGIGSITR